VSTQQLSGDHRGGAGDRDSAILLPMHMPSAGRLIDQPLAAAFGIENLVTDAARRAFDDIDDLALTAGMSGWSVYPITGQVWVGAFGSPHPGVEVELAVRPVPIKGWDGLWQAGIDIGVDCECPINHNMHYVRRAEAQTHLTELPAAVRDLIEWVNPLTGPGHDAPWWRRRVGLD
jgi:hypothetical protein